METKLGDSTPLLRILTGFGGGVGYIPGYFLMSFSIDATPPSSPFTRGGWWVIGEWPPFRRGVRLSSAGFLPRIPRWAAQTKRGAIDCNRITINARRNPRSFFSLFFKLILIKAFHQTSHARRTLLTSNLCQPISVLPRLINKSLTILRTYSIFCNTPRLLKSWMYNVTSEGTNERGGTLPFIRKFLQQSILITMIKNSPGVPVLLFAVMCEYVWFFFFLVALSQGAGDNE
jgi:hypothetical protein